MTRGPSTAPSAAAISSTRSREPSAKSDVRAQACLLARHLHQLEPRTAPELEEVGRKPRRGVLVALAGLRAEPSFVPGAQAFEIIGPEPDVLDQSSFATTCLICVYSSIEYADMSLP